MSELCHCGKPLHYSDPAIQAWVEECIEKFGPKMKITVGDKSYMVPRHYIALHGVKAVELPNLGFEEVA